MLVIKTLLFGITSASQLRLVTEWEVNPLPYGMDNCGKGQAWHKEVPEDPNNDKMILAILK